MKLKITILATLLFCILSVSAQRKWQPYPQPSSFSFVNFDSAIYLPTGCGTPSMSMLDTKYKKALLYFDSCAQKFLYFNPKLSSRSWISLESTGSIDDTSKTILLAQWPARFDSIGTDSFRFKLAESFLNDTVLAAFSLAHILIKRGDTLRVLYLNGDSATVGVVASSGGGSNIYNADGTITDAMRHVYGTGKNYYDTELRFENMGGIVFDVGTTNISCDNIFLASANSGHQYLLLEGGTASLLSDTIRFNGYDVTTEDTSRFKPLVIDKQRGTVAYYSGGWWNSSNSSQWITAGSNIYFNTGTVSIGTDEAFMPLTVHGSGDGIAYFEASDYSSAIAIDQRYGGDYLGIYNTHSDQILADYGIADDTYRYGNGNLKVKGDTVQVDGKFKIPTGAGANKVLTSDANGLASWQNPTIVGGNSITTPLVVSTDTVKSLQYNADYVYRGSEALWTLPTFSTDSSSRAKAISIKNQSQDKMIIKAASGKKIYTDSATNAVEIYPGETISLIPDGTYFSSFTNRPIYRSKENLVLYIGGQSNEGTDPSTGRVDTAYMPTYLRSIYPNVWFWDIALANNLKFDNYNPLSKSMYGWIDQMLFVLSKNYKRIFVIKRAIGGTKIATTGQPDSYNRSDFKIRANAGKLRVDSILGKGNYDVVNLWGQGESDALLSSDAANYESNLNSWVEEFRLAATNNLWIIKKIGNLQKDFPYIPTLTQGQLNAVRDDSRKKIISTDSLRCLGSSTIATTDYGSGDFSHTRKSSNVVIGNRFADTVLAFFGRYKMDTITPKLTTAYIKADGTQLVLGFSENLNSEVDTWNRHFKVGTKVFHTISIINDSVFLTPTVPFYAGSHTLTYKRDSVYRENLQDFYGNEVASVSNYSITNYMVTAEPSITNLYTGNFSTGFDGTWQAYTGASGSAPETSTSGENNCGKIVHTAQTAMFYKFTTSGLVAGTYRIKFKIEIPDNYGYPSTAVIHLKAATTTTGQTILDLSKVIDRNKMSYVEVQWTKTSTNDDVYIQNIVGASNIGQFYFIKDIVIDKLN